MALNPKEELELLQLEEEEYQHSLKAQAPVASAAPMPPIQDDAINQDGLDKQAAFSGLAQGSTFGFSDEMGGAADVAGDVLTGKAPDSLLDKYREYQKLRESANKADAERSPISYTGGEIAGAVGTGFLMPGIGGAKVASIGGRLLGPGAEAFLAAKNATGLAKVAGKATTGLIEGAPLGAAYGIGSSEHTLNEPVELAKDAASSAAMGSLTGASMAAAGAGSGMAYDKLKSAFGDEGKKNILRQAGKAFDYGKKGINLGDDTVLDQLSGKSLEESDKLVESIYKADSLLGQRVGDSINKAQQSGVRINIDPQIQESSSKIANIFLSNPTIAETLDPKSLKLIRTIAGREMGDLTPLETKALRDYLYDLGNNLAGINSEASGAAQKIGYDLAGSLDNALKTQVPEYATAAAKFKEFRAKVPETVINKATPDKYGKTYLGNLKNPELKLQEASEDMLSKAKLPGEAVNKERRTLFQLMENLKALEKSSPEAVEAMGGSAEKIGKTLRSQSDELAMLRHSQGYEPNEGTRGLLNRTMAGISGTGRGFTMTVANKAGLAAQSAPVKMGQKLFTVPNDALLAFAQKLKTVNAHMGDGLERAINNKSDGAKKAILFKLMQDPNYRNLLREEGLGDEE